MTTIYFWSTICGYLLTLLLIPRVLLQEKRPVSTVAWTLLILLAPYVGAALYLVFGSSRIERRVSHRTAANRRIGRRLPELTKYQLLPGEELDSQQHRLVRLANRLSLTRPTVDNQVKLLNDTNQTLGLIEQAVLTAQESLHLEYYIWQPDRTGKRVRDILIQKAREGVRIRFLYDGVGSMFLGREFLRPMIDAGIQVAAFQPGRSFRERWSINLRSHRKIVIVDGQIGFTGGMNIGDEYLGRNPHYGYWRDTHLKLHGPIVLQLQQVFAEDWYYATGEELTNPALYPHPRTAGDSIAQIVASGPDNEFNSHHALFFAAIAEAKHHICLATGYFVPTEPLMVALITAALRGVKVRLLLSGRGNYPWMLYAGRSYYEDLLEAGVEIHEYQKGLLHSKTLTVDGMWSIVGSANFDVRSLLLNFEVGVAVYDPDMAQELETAFNTDVAAAKPFHLESWRKRGLKDRLLENSMRLFSPVF